MKRVYFLPRYIGALKYYEKIFPALRTAGAQPVFLLFEDAGMLAYCKERNLPFDDRFLAVSSGRIPFVSHFLRERKVFSMLDGFLGEIGPSTFVTEANVSQRVRALHARAQTRGMRTLSLQFSVTSEDGLPPGRLTLASRLLILRDQQGSVVKGLLYKVYLGILNALFRLSDALSGEEYFLHRDRHVDQIGVISELWRDAYVRHGWPREKIRIVGYAEHTVMADVALRLTQDSAFRSELHNKYGLDPSRKKILVLSTPFYRGAYAVFLDQEGQRKYFGKIFEDIRSVFDASEADILFKLHPREPNIYSEHFSRDIRLFHNDADLYELIALSNLYVAHPATTSNYVVQASGVPAIFINFTPLAFLNVGSKFYGLRSIAESHEEFRTLLQSCKEGTLPLQYDASQVDIHALAHIVDFIRGER